MIQALVEGGNPLVEHPGRAVLVAVLGGLLAWLIVKILDSRK